MISAVPLKSNYMTGAFDAETHGLMVTLLILNHIIYWLLDVWQAYDNFMVPKFYRCLVSFSLILIKLYCIN